MFKKKWPCCWAARSRRRKSCERRHRGTHPIVGVKAACEALNIPRASFYRKRGLGVFRRPAAVRFFPRALDSAERGVVLACFMRRDFRTAHRPRSTLRCSTKAAIIAPFARCTGFWRAKERRVSAATNSFIRLTRSRNFWRQVPPAGAGTSRNCWGRRNGRTSTST